MPRIPAYEDLGNQPAVVEDKDFFGLLALGYVESHVGVEIETDVPQTGEDFDYSYDPFQTIRDGGEQAVEAAKQSIVYGVHYALHMLFAETYQREDGQVMRNVLMRQYVKLQRHYQQDAVRAAAAAN